MKPGEPTFVVLWFPPGARAHMSHPGQWDVQPCVYSGSGAERVCADLIAERGGSTFTAKIQLPPILDAQRRISDRSADRDATPKASKTSDRK